MIHINRHRSMLYNGLKIELIGILYTGINIILQIMYRYDIFIIILIRFHIHYFNF